MIDPNAKGDVGELMVCADLIGRGYSVYRAVNKNARADIVVMDSMARLYKVQIKTTVGDESGAILELRKHCLNPKYNSIYTNEEIDVFALYVMDKRLICYISAQEALSNRCAIKFRYELAKNGQKKNIRLVDDYQEFPLYKG